MHASSLRYLHDCSQIRMPFGNAFFNTRYGGLVVRIYCLMPVFLHTFQRENTYAKLHENASFEMKNYKNFLGRGNAPSPDPTWEGIPTPRTPVHPPRRLRRLDAHAFGTRSPMGNCHGSPQILETSLRLKHTYTIHITHAQTHTILATSFWHFQIKKSGERLLTGIMTSLHSRTLYSFFRPPWLDLRSRPKGLCFTVGRYFFNGVRIAP